jgi:hypothetical protein
MSNIIIELFTDIILSIITLLITLASSLQRQTTRLRCPTSRNVERLSLEAQRSFLLSKRAVIDNQITELDRLLESEREATSPDAANHVPKSSERHDEAIVTVAIPSISPDRNCQRRHGNRVGRRVAQFPLPFSPPRTPEEVRRNNIIMWLNEIRARNNNNDFTNNN